jgi:predicted transcriptional regulator
MRTKRLLIKIQTAKQTLDQFVETYHEMTTRKVTPRKKKKPESILYFSNFTQISKVFSKPRLEIIRAIQEHEPKSINALASILKRSQPNVFRDVKFLASIGVIELEVQKSRSSKKPANVAPRFHFSGFEIDLAA